MNANQLADALQETEPYYSTDYKLFDKAATMLRQQSKEIEVLNQAFGILFKHRIEQEKENQLLKTELEDCICQGGHSEAYLKIKER